MITYPLALARGNALSMGVPSAGAPRYSSYTSFDQLALYLASELVHMPQTPWEGYTSLSTHILKHFPTLS